MKDERLLYEPARRALEKYFKKFGECHLEVTSEGAISEPLKDLLEEHTPLTLYLNSIESFRPDLTGWFAKEYYQAYGKKEIIVVEVKKEKPEIKDIFRQARVYGEVFGAKHSLIVTPEPIPAQKRKILEDRPVILSYSDNREQVRICQLNVEKEEIMKDSWFPSPPM